LLRGVEHLRRLVDLVPDPVRRSTLLADVATTCAPVDADAAAALAAAAVDAASYLEADDDRLRVLPGLLHAWQAVAATGRRPALETLEWLVDLAHAAPEQLYRLHLLVTITRLYAGAPDEAYETGLIDVVMGLANTLVSGAPDLEKDPITAELIPMYLDLGRRDLAEQLFASYAGDAFSILDGFDAFVPAGAEPWLAALAEAVDEAEPYIGSRLLLRLAAVHIRLDQPDQAREHIARALTMLLDQQMPDRDAMVLAGTQLRVLGADDLYTTLAERLVADGRAGLLEQPDDATFRMSAGTQHAGQTLVAIGDLDRALVLARAMQPFERDDLYDRIAAAYARAGRLDEALALTEEAADIAAGRTFSIRLTEGEAEPGTLEVVRALVLAGRRDDAFAVVYARRNPDSEAALLYGIVLALLRVGDRAAAAELLSGLEAHRRDDHHFYDWYETARTLVRLLGRAGHWATAVAFHRTWDDSTYQWQPTRELAGKLVAAGEFDAARELLADTDVRAETAGLLEIAKLAGPEDRDAALADAERLVDDIDSRWAQAEGYTMIAKVRLQHDPAGARRLLHRAIEASAGIDVAAERSLIYPNTTPHPEICAALVRAGDPDGALALFHRIPVGDHVDRAMAAGLLADAFDATASDVDVTALLYEVADSIQAAADETWQHPRALVLAALARRGLLADLLDRYQVGRSERAGLLEALTARLDDDHAVEAAWELLRELDGTGVAVEAGVGLVDAFLQRRRPEDALAVLPQITDRQTRARPVAWCAAYLAQHARPDAARALVAEATELLPELSRADADAGVALGLAILTLDGRAALVGALMDGWAAAATLSVVARRLPLVTWLTDDAPALADRLADGYAWARSFQTSADRRDPRAGAEGAASGART
jgi:tetratricopeptide (TPR) repeat protein